MFFREVVVRPTRFAPVHFTLICTKTENRNRRPSSSSSFSSVTAELKRHVCGQKSSRRGVTTFENIQGGIEANTTSITRITTIELERVAWFVIYHWRTNIGDAPTTN
jgi:hypothetical protein